MAFDPPAVAAAADRLRSALPATPRVAVVLGSGLGVISDRLSEPVAVAFGELGDLPEAGVTGHAGRFVQGTLGGQPLLLQAGRYHAYEGHSMDVVVAPVRIMAALGVEVVVFTNAVGGIGPAMAPGELVLIDDHIGLAFRSPLAGPVQEAETRFPDMSEPYDRRLQELALEIAVFQGVELHRGTYAWVLGPSFETAAEIRMMRDLGADVVGMSTVPEVTTARALGLRCVTFSMVTNRATGLGDGEISHEEVLEIGKEAGGRLAGIVSAMVERIVASDQSTGAK